MAKDTANINLKIIENSDMVSKDLLNTNIEILDAEIAALQEGQEPIPVMLERLDDLENAQNLLAPRVTTAELNIAQLGSTVTALQGDVAALQTEMAEKAKIDDSQEAAGTTYSSEKIIEVIEEKLSELEIDNLSINAIKQDLAPNKYLKVNDTGTAIEQVSILPGSALPSVSIPMFNPVNGSCSAILQLRSARTLKTVKVASTDYANNNAALVPNAVVTLRVYKDSMEQFNFVFSTAEIEVDNTDVEYVIGETSWCKVETEATNLKLLNIHLEFE